MREVGTDRAVLNEPQKKTRSEPQGRKLVARYWGELVVVTIALLLWVPRLSGPIDLRWDGGVYYLLGTSLAQGHGYRIPSEPGWPKAIQYPPLLPAFVALHEWVLKSTDPAVVAPWLRKTYAAIFLSYGIAVFALARRHLATGFALAATLLVLLYSEAVFFSDLLYAELPFALVGVLFALVATGRPLFARPWLRETAAFLLATVGVLLRTAGVALLAAWVLEAVMRRRWRLGVARGSLALLPIIAWQAHVMRVRSSDQYAHPAYEYQRAVYNFNNVSYTDNVSLVNPFRPELGRLSAARLTARLMKNAPRLVAALGETVSLKKDGWEWLLRKAQGRLVGHRIIPDRAALLPILPLAALGVIGLLIFVYRGAWLTAFIVLGSIVLVWTTPWANQFTRYLVPLAPFLAICTILAISEIRAWLTKLEPGSRVRVTLRVALLAVIVFSLTAQMAGLVRVFHQRQDASAVSYVPEKRRFEGRFFMHDNSWRDLEAAAAWIDRYAPSEAIVATSQPHLFYLWYGPPRCAAAARRRSATRMWIARGRSCFLCRRG